MTRVLPVCEVLEVIDLRIDFTSRMSEIEAAHIYFSFVFNTTFVREIYIKNCPETIMRFGALYKRLRSSEHINLRLLSVEVPRPERGGVWVS